MPKLQAARVTQCGLDFAVVLVDPKLFMNPSELEAFSERAQALFPGVPVAMLSYDDLKVTRYHGPDDVVAFLKQVRVAPFKRARFTASCFSFPKLFHATEASFSNVFPVCREIPGSIQ